MRIRVIMGLLAVSIALFAVCMPTSTSEKFLLKSCCTDLQLQQCVPE